MSLEGPRDDLNAYIATFTDEEQRELTYAAGAIDLYGKLWEMRPQAKVTLHDFDAFIKRSREAIGVWRREHPSVPLKKLTLYLRALGYPQEFGGTTDEDELIYDKWLASLED